MKLDIAPNLSLPKNTVSATIIVYGGKGQGKTNFGSVVAEELYARNLRFSVIDPMGVWFGLQHGRTKEESGIEVLILGGIHGDIPINPHSGEIVADLVADERVSVIIDISRHENGKAWSKGEKIRFVRDYMIRLYERQVEHRYPIMQIIDEAARYAPQNFITGDKDSAQCFGAIQTICEEGRNIGIGLMLLTQRSARLNKDVAELADMLVAFRIVGPNSASAILDWFGDHIPKERHKALMERLRQLPKGTALIVSPGWLNIEGEANIRLRHTFDSSATPEIGKTLKAPGKAKKPDLEKYRSRMAETIKEAEDNNPKKLQSRIKSLEAENQVLRDRPEPEAVPAPAQCDHAALIEQIETFIQSDQDIQIESITRLDMGLRSDINELCEKAEREGMEIFAAGIRRLRHTLREIIVSGQPVPAPSPRASIPKPEAQASIPKPAPKRSAPNPPAGNGSPDILSPLHQSMLNGIALLERIGESNPTMAQVGAVIGKSHKSGRIRQAFNQTQDMGMAMIDGLHIRLTEAGRSEAIAPNIHSRADIHRLWTDRLNGNELEFLQVLIKEYPDSINLMELGDRIGKSMKSGRVRGALNALRDKGLAHIIEDDRAIASALLFPAGLH